MIREHYPEAFQRIQDKVSEGDMKPNGAVWVECDCNITSGRIYDQAVPLGTEIYKENTFITHQTHSGFPIPSDIPHLSLR